jgi:hypothetical protein
MRHCTSDARVFGGTPNTARETHALPGSHHSGLGVAAFGRTPPLHCPPLGRETTRKVRRSAETPLRHHEASSLRLDSRHRNACGGQKASP